MEPAVQRIRDYFARLTRGDLARLAEIYTEDATFKDPFNAVQGRAAIARIFEHMFDVLSAPSFVVHEAVAQGHQAFLTWDFRFEHKGQVLVVHGATHLRLAADGRIAMHRDYWDAAEEVYERLPVLGPLLRWLRRRFAA